VEKWHVSLVSGQEEMNWFLVLIEWEVIKTEDKVIEVVLIN